MNVLVVDDDQIVLAACTRILTSEGNAVTVASSVDEARDRLESQRFDLLLLDVIMPGCDGVELMRMVRERGLNVPTLAMSGYPTNENIDRALAAGAARLVSKPFTPVELLDAIRMVFGETNSDQEETNGNKEDPSDR